MVLWKGWGILTLIIPLIFSWSANFAFDSMYGDGFYQNSAWAMPLIIGLSSIPVGIIGYVLSKKPGRKLIDPETSEIIELKTTHTFFLIPMQYWSLIIVGICGWMYAANIGVIYQ